MARPPAWRHDAGSYPHRAAVQTRFQDMDVLGHINNVAWGALFETARVRFNRDIGLLAFHGHRWLVAKVEINYLAEGHFPEDVEIATGIGTIGTRSWHVLATAFQRGQAVATCDVVLVMSAETGAAALPADLRAILERFRVTAAD